MVLNSKKFLGLIPARGGSKRLKNKNTRMLAGKPLIAWTLEAGKQSCYLDDLIVSTEDSKIAEISRCYGGNVPFLRPQELASDTATTQAVMEHALITLESLTDKTFDYLVLLQPTSPLRTSEDIDRAIELVLERNAEGVASVCAVDHPPEWMNILPADGSLKGFLREDVIGKRSQELPVWYRLNGAIMIIATEALREGKDFWSLERIYAYPMMHLNSVDIDTELDFLLAETILKQQGRNHEANI